MDQEDPFGTAVSLLVAEVGVVEESGIVEGGGGGWLEFWEDFEVVGWFDFCGDFVWDDWVGFGVSKF